MDKIRELVTSWRTGDILKLAVNDEKVLMELLALTHDDDSAVRLRAVSVLNSLVKSQEGTRVKQTIVENSFERLMKLLNDKDSRVVIRTLEMLPHLVDGVSISKEMFMMLVDAASRVADTCDSMMYISLVDVFCSMHPPQLKPEELSLIDNLLSSKNLYRRALGACLYLVAGGVPGMDVSTLMAIRDMISCNEHLLVETGLKFLEEFLECPHGPDVMHLLPSLFSVLKGVEKTADSIFLRSGASKVRSKLERALITYYRSRVEEGGEVAKRLLAEGKMEDAFNLVLIIGEGSLLKDLWTAEEDFGAELMELPRHPTTS